MECPQQSAALHSGPREGNKSNTSKTREHGRLLVYGVGIGMEQETLTEIMMLVGRVCGRNYSLGWLKNG